MKTKRNKNLDSKVKKETRGVRKGRIKGERKPFCLLVLFPLKALNSLIDIKVHKSTWSSPHVAIAYNTTQPTAIVLPKYKHPLCLILKTTQMVRANIQEL